jgi:hypothetical protein
MLYRRPPGFGQEVSLVPTYAKIERAPTTHEQELWERAETLKKRCIMAATIMRLQHTNLTIAAQFAASRGIPFPSEGLADLEVKMLNALTTVDTLRRYHCDVNALKLGVRPSVNGDDLDIISPEQTGLGLPWVPIIYGIILVTGIVGTWIYKDKEIAEIIAKYGGVEDKADKAFCADPNSANCKDWTKIKNSGDFRKNTTLMESIKGAIGKIGGGIGSGIALLIPLVVAFLYLRRKM